MDLTQKKIFAERLGLLRTKADLTQQQLAEVTGIPRETIAKYETVKRIPSFEHLTIFATYFKTTTDYLLGLSGNPSNDPDICAVYNYTGLSKEAITAVHNCSKKDVFTMMFIDNLLANELNGDGLLLSLARYCLYKPIESDFIITKYASIRLAGIYDEMENDDLARISSTELIDQVYLSEICNKVKGIKTAYNLGQKAENLIKEALRNGKYNPKNE